MRRCAQPAGQQLPGRDPVQGSQRLFPYPGQTPHVSEPASQVVWDLAGADCRHDRKPSRSRPGHDIHEHVERTLVRPLKIVHNQQHRLLLAPFAQPRVERRGSISEDAPLCGHGRLAGRDQGREGHGGGLQRQAGPPQAQDRVPGIRAHPLSQAGLSGSGLAFDKQAARPALRRIPHQLNKLRYLAGAASQNVRLWPLFPRHATSVPLTPQAPKPRI